MDDPTVVVVSPGGESTSEKTAPSAGSQSDGPSNPETHAEAAVAAAAQQAVETGTQLGVLEAKVDALSAQVAEMKSELATGHEQQARLLLELDLALQSVGEAMETVEETVTEESGAIPVQVETPNPAVPVPPVRPASPLRKLVLGG